VTNLHPSRQGRQDRYKLTIEYDGTGYSGWQEQENARTIQGTLQKAALTLFKGPVDIQGAGRTDAGVHALGQVAHLVAGSRLRPAEIRNGLNDNLPSNINVLDVSPAGRGFHARHDACLRSYLYAVSTRRSAFLKRYIWWVRDRLDVTAMRCAADLFGGMHDFAAYADKRSDPDKSAKVLLERPEIREVGTVILIRVAGSHFLWKMVRRMVGVLVEVGRGKIGTGDVAATLCGPNELPARLTAPPSGLFLERVLYRSDELPPLSSVAWPPFA